MAVATAPIETPVGVLAPGTVAAQRFSWQGTVDGEPVITVRVNWLMGEQHLDPPWTIGGERFEVEVQGDPSIHVTLRGLQPPFEHADLDRNPGIVATAMHCVNSIPYVCDAAARHPDLPRPAADHRPSRRGAATLAGRSPARVRDRTISRPGCVDAFSSPIKVAALL